jgi:phage host-nuclease inhibitor protein Gam
MSNEQPKKSQLSKLAYIKLDAIDSKDETLQTRHTEALKGVDQDMANRDSKRNVSELVQELRRINEGNTEDYRQGHLKPIVVWREPGASTGQYIIVSGFHRYKAYQEYNRLQSRSPKKRKKTIPAYLFSGTKDEAMLYSANQDIEPVLTKTKRQKLNAAWAEFLGNNEVVLKSSGRQLAVIFGVSRSEIDKMKRIKKQLNKDPSLKKEPDWKTQKWRIENPDAEVAMRDEAAMIEMMVSKLHRELFIKACQSDKVKLVRVIRGLCESASIEEDTMEEILEDNDLQGYDSLECSIENDDF